MAKRAGFPEAQSGGPDRAGLGLPGMDGLEVVPKRLRGQGNATPIVILSSRDDEAGKVAALDLGADDYVSKPFGVEELSARIRAALRHRLQQEGEKPCSSSGDADGRSGAPRRDGGGRRGEADAARI